MRSLPRLLYAVLLALHTRHARSQNTIGFLADGTRCRSTDGIFSFDMENSVLAISNLGGLGPDFGQPPVMLIRDVGNVPGGPTVDLRISNKTLYALGRPSHNFNNGFRTSENGTFGTIGLGVPRRGNVNSVNIVELRFEFLDGATGQPLSISRSFVSFYDFDILA